MQFIYRTSYFRIEANAEANKVITSAKNQNSIRRYWNSRKNKKQQSN
jgi:hypothetical protein